MMTELIIGVAAISAIAAVLAFLLEAAHSIIANYGQVRIIINDEKELEVAGGEPLLSTLGANRIFLPSACGGKGTCGYCKVRLLEGGDPVLPTERPYLSTEELERRVRISCQVKVKSDMKIEIPRELFNVKEYRVRVERIRELTSYIRGLRLEVTSPEEGISFIPGQYVQLEVPAYDLSSGPEFRAYSIASDARDHHAIELVITRVEKGIVSTYVHDYLKEGSELTLRGPFGEFRLLDSDRDILLIATGSGLAPIMSILYQMEAEQIGRKATLFFGARRPDDLFFVEEMRALEERLAAFTFVPTLSRVKEGGEWQGETGRVTDLIQSRIPDAAEVDVHICGAPAMVQSCVDLLLKKGIPSERIVYDKFE